MRSSCLSPTFCKRHASVIFVQGYVRAHTITQPPVPECIDPTFLTIRGRVDADGNYPKIEKQVQDKRRPTIIIVTQVWGLLQWRHVTCSMDPSHIRVSAQLRSLTLNISPVYTQNLGFLVTISRFRVLHTLKVALHGSSDWQWNDMAMEKLSVLRNSSSLETLTVLLGWNKIGDKGARLLGRFNECATLRNLHIHLNGNIIGNLGIEDLARQLSHLSSLETLSLYLNRNIFGSHGIRALAHLRECVSLRALSLHLNRLESAQTAGVLGTLKDCHSLRTLDLSLICNNLVDEDIIGLADLRESTSLQTLVLNLDHNAIGASGAKAIGLLYESNSLQHVNVTIAHNPLYDEGVAALALLGRSRSLKTLHLDLRGSFVGSLGAEALGRMFTGFSLLHTLHLKLNDAMHVHHLALLQNHQSLQSLTLWLHCIYVGFFGAQSLGRLADCPLLHTLSLEFERGFIGDEGAQALGEKLRTAQRLQVLKIRVESDDVGTGGATAFANLRECPMLHTLSLQFIKNRICDEGARALGLLKHSRCLQSLKIQIECDWVTDCGVQALSELGSCHTLQTLTLHLGHNQIGDTGAQALAMLDNWHLNELHIYLHNNNMGSAGVTALNGLITNASFSVFCWLQAL